MIYSDLEDMHGEDVYQSILCDYYDFITELFPESEIWSSKRKVLTNIEFEPTTYDRRPSYMSDKKYHPVLGRYLGTIPKRRSGDSEYLTYDGMANRKSMTKAECGAWMIDILTDHYNEIAEEISNYNKKKERIIRLGKALNKYGIKNLFNEIYEVCSIYTKSEYHNKINVVRKFNPPRKILYVRGTEAKTKYIEHIEIGQPRISKGLAFRLISPHGDVVESVSMDRQHISTKISYATFFDEMDKMLDEFEEKANRVFNPLYEKAEDKLGDLRSELKKDIFFNKLRQ